MKTTFTDPELAQQELVIENHPQTVQPESTILTNLGEKAVYTTLPVIALLSAISPLIFTIYLLKQGNPEIESSEKIALPMAVWALVASAQFWLQLHLLARRGDGLVDAPVSTSAQRDDVPHVALALLASTTALLNGVVVMISANPSNALRLSVGATILGSFDWLAWMMGDLQATWRKYTEGTDIKQLRQQPIVNHLYRSEKLNIVVRELYPVVTGIVRAQAFYQALQGLLPQTGGAKALAFALSALIYEASALTTRNFEIQHMHDCSDGSYSMQSYWVESALNPVRFLGKTINGQLLADGLEKLHFSPLASARVIATLNAVGLAALIQRVFTNNITSSDLAKVQNGTEAMVLEFYAGVERAVALSKKIAPLTIGLAIFLPAIQAYTRITMVAEQIKKDRLQDVRRVTAYDDNAALNALN